MLVERLGIVPARTCSPDIDESPRPGEMPRLYALRMAEEKARAVPRGPNEVVLAGDTTVAVGRRILGQAEDEAMQRGFLKLLGGRRHHVLSAVSTITADGRQISKLSDSIVKFKPLHPDEITAYVESGDPRQRFPHPDIADMIVQYNGWATAQPDWRETP